MRKVFIILLIITSLAGGFITAKPVSAFQIMPDCDLKSVKDGGRPCEVDDFLRLALQLIQFMLGITGSLALLFFVYGGFTMLISAGNTEKVQHGKDIVTAAAIGVLVVLASWMIINFTYTALGGKNIEWWEGGWTAKK